jgi:hypothetical protein
MFRWVPIRFEQTTAVPFQSAPHYRIAGFDAFRQRGRIGELHVHGRNRGHGEIAAIERICDESQCASLCRNIDRQPVAHRQFIVELDDWPNGPRAGRAPNMRALK